MTSTFPRPSPGKVIITGPGRAGTSFLVQLLTRLGEDTGFEPGREPFSDELRAGCEQRIIVDLTDGEVTRERIAAAPRVLKSPDWSFALKGLVRAGWIDVAHVIIPFREFEASAASRLSVGLDWMCVQTDDAAAKLADQANIHGLAFGRALEACLICGLPYTVLMFPRLVEDAGYLFDGLSRAFDFERGEFTRQWQSLTKT